MSEKRKHEHRSEAEWRTILERFKVSGQSQLAFCSEAGIAPTTFQLWRRRLRQDRAASARFVEVTPAAPPAPRWAIEIELRDGTITRVRG
jgi:transposase-like protein